MGKALLSTLQPQQRRLYLAEQGMRPFTSRTATDMDELEAEIRALVPGRAVFEHGEFRPGWSCAAVLVPRQDPRDPWWALSVSARAEDVPAEVCARLLDVASSLSEAG